MEPCQPRSVASASSKEHPEDGRSARTGTGLRKARTTHPSGVGSKRAGYPRPSGPVHIDITSLGLGFIRFWGLGLGFRG